MNRKLMNPLSLILVVIIVLICKACKDDSNAIEENPIFTMLSLPGTKVDTIEKAAKIWEYGFRFTPLKAGAITKFGIKVPSVGKYKVRFYTLDNDSLVQELEIESKVKHEEYYLNVSNLRIKPGAEYGLSLIADAFFKVKHTDSTAISFPMTIGNIKVLSFNEEACGITGCGDFPDNINSLVIAPCVTLGYIGDE
jgi:hypothetical protein